MTPIRLPCPYCGGLGYVARGVPYRLGTNGDGTSDFPCGACDGRGEVDAICPDCGDDVTTVGATQCDACRAEVAP